MGKKKTTKAPAQKAGALTQEEFQKLSPEEQLEYVAKLQAANAELSAKAAEGKKGELPTVEVEDGENPGTYQWTAPTFTWDDNSVIKVSELMADADGKDEKVALKAQAIIAGLIQRGSGLLVRKED